MTTRKELLRGLTMAEIIQAREELVEIGLVRDSGRRSRNPHTGEMEIVWEAVPESEIKPRPH